MSNIGASGSGIMSHLVGAPTSGGGGGYASLLTGLQAWWDFEEATGGAGTIRYDSHGSNDLTVYSNTVYQVAGQAGFAADGETASNPYMRRDNNVNDLEPRVDGFSFAGWFKTPSTWYPATYQTAIHRGTGNFSNQSDYVFTRHNASNKWRWSVYTSTGTNYSVDWATVLSTNTWYFVYLEYEGTGNTIGISLNNETLQTAAGPADIHDSGEAGSFFLNYWSSSGSWLGKYTFDSVGMWSRILTTDERTWLSTPRSYSDI